MCAAFKEETVRLSAAQVSVAELHRLAERNLLEKTLSHELLDLLVDKIYVYPDTYVEVLWKSGNF